MSINYLVFFFFYFFFRFGFFFGNEKCVEKLLLLFYGWEQFVIDLFEYRVLQVGRLRIWFWSCFWRLADFDIVWELVNCRMKAKLSSFTCKAVNEAKRIIQLLKCDTFRLNNYEVRPDILYLANILSIYPYTHIVRRNIGNILYLRMKLI